MILKAKQLVKTYAIPAKVEVLRGIDLEVAEGESIAVMGKSGEGKSTLLHILGTLEKPSSGELEICGEPVSPANFSTLRQKKVGFIFQAYNLLEDYTVLQNILMPARIAREDVRPHSPLWNRAMELLRLVDMQERAEFPAKLLSGGEKQRVAIARAFCNDPEILFADEPTGNLDHATSALIHHLLLSCVKKFHKTLIVVTHDRELAALCDRTLILRDGQLCNS